MDRSYRGLYGLTADFWNKPFMSKSSVSPRQHIDHISGRVPGVPFLVARLSAQSSPGHARQSVLVVRGVVAVLQLQVRDRESCISHQMLLPVSPLALVASDLKGCLGRVS